MVDAEAVLEDKGYDAQERVVGPYDLEIKRK
jgi:hypothetical protein